VNVDVHELVGLEHAPPVVLVHLLAGEDHQRLCGRTRPSHPHPARPARGIDVALARRTANRPDEHPQRVALGVAERPEVGSGRRHEVELVEGSSRAIQHTAVVLPSSTLPPASSTISFVVSATKRSGSVSPRTQRALVAVARVERLESAVVAVVGDTRPSCSNGWVFSTRRPPAEASLPAPPRYTRFVVSYASRQQ
jgi:hypothetical protein